MRKHRIERNLAFPTEEFRRRVRSAAKERGFRTEQAFILAACENELKRGDAAEATATKGLNTAQQTHLQGPAAAAGAGVNEGSVTEDQASRVVERTLTLQNA